MEKLDHDDIQGFLARGYGNLPDASYLLFQIKDPLATKVWLNDLLKRVTPSSQKPAEKAFNIGFTCEGLRVLGLHEDDLKTFSLPFFEGMAAPHRSRIYFGLQE